MAVTIKELVPAKYAENTQTTQYTALARTVIDKCTVSNASGAIATIAINLVPTGGSATDANLVMPERQIADGETYTCPEVVGQVLDIGSFISTVADTGSALSLRISGREITGIL